MSNGLKAMSKSCLAPDVSLSLALQVTAFRARSPVVEIMEVLSYIESV
jgi:hypothetical protein